MKRNILGAITGLTILLAGCSMIDETTVTNTDEQIFSGRINLLHLDYGDDQGLHRSEELIQMFDNEGTLIANLDPRSLPIDRKELQAGSHLEVSGYQDGKLLVVDQILSLTQPDRGIELRSGKGNGKGSGTITEAEVTTNDAPRILAILVNTGSVTIPCSEAEVAALLNSQDSAAYSLSNFYRAATFGAVQDFTVDITSVFTDKQPDCNNLEWFGRNIDRPARSNGFDAKNYDQVIYILDELCPYLGAFQDGRIVIDKCSLPYAYSHEYGHAAFGFFHASKEHDNGSTSEYGDFSDVMGGDQITFNAIHKSKAGWIPADKVQEYTTADTFQVSAANIHPDQATGAMLVKLPTPYIGDFYVSYRTPTGSLFDRNLPVAYQYKIAIHRWDGTNTRLLALLDVGESFTVSDHSFSATITVLSTDAEYASVHIHN